MGQSRTVYSNYYKSDIWAVENTKYAEPHLRLLKVARITNDLAGEERCDLLDVGCGPGTLKKFLRSNIAYHGIDISIPDPAPGLMETDLLDGPIDFNGKRFDIVVAQGLFEYLGEHQLEKLSEIARLLRPGGKFLVSYVNFGHRRPTIYHLYNNVQDPGAFQADLDRFFTVRRRIPTSHNWQHQEPSKWPVKALNMRLDLSLPFLSPKLAVQYLFVCSHADSAGSPERSRA